MSTNLSGMDLAGLIRRMKGGRAYEKLADASGGVISRQRWQQLGVQKSSAELPEPATLRAIATVLGVSERTVVLAAARTAGLEVEENGGSLATLLPPSVDRLSDTQVAAVLTVIRALLEARHGDTPAISQPADAGAPNDRDVARLEAMGRALADQDRAEQAAKRHGQTLPKRRR